jgi:intracellular sulfur oxidation DsrE/DsrF family protein
MAGYKGTRTNPFLKSTKPEEASVESLVKGGTIFFACNNATQGFAHLLASIAKSPPRAMYDRLVAGLVPGASLVPAGVWAVHALQDRHYTYLQTTL